jgi:hypothetical protein
LAERATTKKPDTAVQGDAFDSAAIEDDNLSDVIDLTVETLTGDVRDFILDRVRFEQDKRPWSERSESDQRDTIQRVEEHVHDVVRRAVELIAAQGRRTIKATLEQVTVKDGIVGKIVMSKFDEQRHALVDSTGSTILIVVADPDDFVGERAPAEVKPDQAELITEALVVHSTADGHAETPFH